MSQTKANTVVSISFELTSEQQQSYDTLLDWLTNVDMFRHDFIGDFATPISGSNGKWLIFCQVDGNIERAEWTDKLAISNFKNGKYLPLNYYLLDEEIARKAIETGLKLKGLNFFEESDSTDIDYCLQIALFGEEVFV